MALAVSRAMNLGEQQNLHPFFVKPQRNPSPEPENKNEPTEQTFPDTKDDQTSPSSNEPRPRGRPLGSRTQRGKRKNGAPVSAERGKQTSLARFAQHGDRRSGETAGMQQVDEATSLEEDPNIGRRKRQKTVTPQPDESIAETAPVAPVAPVSETEVEPKQSLVLGPVEPEKASWHEQLQEAVNTVEAEVQVPASSPWLEPNANASRDPMAKPGSPPVQDAPTDATEMGIPASSPPPPSGNLPTDLMNSPHASASDAEKERVKMPESTPRRSTRPKKMLRLNANGRLSSPIPTATTEQAKSEVKQPLSRGKRGKKQAQQLVVKLKYSRDGNETGSAAVKIDQILAGTLRIPIPKTKPIKSTSKKPPPTKPTSKKQSPIKPPSKEPSPRKPSKATGPPKTTHPFFLAKATLDSSNESKVSKETVRNDSDSTKTVSARRETACTPGKLRAQARSAQPAADFPNFGSFGQPKIVKHPGSSHAPWPWKGIVRVGEADGILPLPSVHSTEDAGSRLSKILCGRRKLKDNVYGVPDEEDLIQLFTCELRKIHDGLREHIISPSGFPRRLLTVGPDIQCRVQEQLESLMQPTGAALASSQDSIRQRPKTHPALANLFHDIKTTLTPFDQGECEAQAWTQKYAPKRTNDVLQSSREVGVLRSWLEALTVNVVETGKKDPAKKSPVKGGSKKGSTAKLGKKKRKRTEDMDDFIVSSEEESVMSELTDPEDTAPSNLRHGAKKSLIHFQGEGAGTGSSDSKLKNAVLLSGPHGCGKTAAVYAVANELGFEVFEINPGSRRSGKDVMDKIGDMTENHLVQRRDREPQDQAQIQADADDERLSNAVQRDIESGKQASMNSFFKPMKKENTAPKPKTKDSVPKPGQDETAKSQATFKQPKRGQKQSLILLEEVDVLFEEDKSFWLTIFSLVVQSRRPIIMTCNNEDLVPLAAVDLHAILRLSPAPPMLAADYLLLMAAREGHLLERSAVTDLYSSRNHDLRASITELDFWCQMAVGDRKGGLEWMYQRWPPGADVDSDGQTLRVASEGTYQSGLGFLSHDAVSEASHCAFDKDHEKLLEVCEGWGLDIAEHAPRTTSEESTGGGNQHASQYEQLNALQDLERFTEASSAADIFCRVGLPHSSKDTMDASQPSIREKTRHDFIEGMPLLQVDPLTDYTSLDTHIAIRSHLAAYRSCSPFPSPYAPHSDLSTRSQSLHPDAMYRTALAQLSVRHNARAMTRWDFAAAFDPISEAPAAALSTASNQLTASSFDRTFALITTELAPYVRSIAAYDLRLEAERLRLGTLLSEGGKPGKRARTTRAARSALEGGKRATTRRERWFCRELSLSLVMGTAGKQWAGMGGSFGDAEEKESLAETGSVSEE